MKELLRFLSQVLHSDYNTSNQTQYSFSSPFVLHRKRKLSINLDVNSKKFGFYHCWISDEGGRSLFSLLKKINKKEYINELCKILNNLKVSTTHYKDSEPSIKVISLPKEFISLSKKSINLEYKKAIRYAEKRNITLDDIKKYKIGYCSEGLYGGYLIIPSYNEKFQLNYFIGRRYHKHVNPKYRNPKLSKNIIIFDNLINWSEEINLCEGIIDAIAIKVNAIPLLGKNLSRKLYIKILENKPSKVNIILDTDAYEEALYIADTLMRNNINCDIIKLKNKDPAIIGYKQMYKKIYTLQNNSIDKYELLKNKLHEKN